MAPELCTRCEEHPGVVRCSCKKRYCRNCHIKHCANPAFANHYEIHGLFGLRELALNWSLGKAQSFQAEHFAKDEVTKWFGVMFETVGEERIAKLVETPRFQELLLASRGHSLDSPGRQFPSIVSFVGETGSGKSTLS
jgi:hypothetical protein